MLKNLKHWKTTVIGVVTIILFALVSFNVLTADQSEEIKIALEKIIDASGGDLMGFLTVAFGSISAILALFVKDPDKKE
jgi:hypothetical protein